MAVGLDADDRRNRVGVSIDVSTHGARINTASRFAEGDDVRLTLVHEASSPRVTCDASVVRCETVDSSSYALWRYVIAVKFARPLPEVEASLRRFAKTT
jgi:hypothetical protein